MKICEKYPIIGQFARFVVIGVLNTSIDLAVLNFLMFATGHSEGYYYSVFKAASFSAAVITSYFLNKHWAFGDKGKRKEIHKISQFMAVSIIGALINVGVASSVVLFLKPQLIEILPFSNQLWGNIGALCGTAIGLIWNFLGYKFIVFKK